MGWDGVGLVDSLLLFSLSDSLVALFLETSLGVRLELFLGNGNSSSSGVEIPFEETVFVGSIRLLLEQLDSEVHNLIVLRQKFKSNIRTTSVTKYISLYYIHYHPWVGGYPVQ